MAYLMGIDLGTSSLKTMIIDLDGTMKSCCSESYKIDIPGDGYAEQEPETWWKAVVSTVSRALAAAQIRSSDIRGIGFSGQMHGTVLLDANGELICPAIIWCDQRSQKQVETIYSRLGRERFEEVTLNPVSSGFQLATLLWLKGNEPDNYAKIHTCILPKDYIRYRLTGTISTDITDASGTLAFDTSMQEWAWDLIEELELPRSVFPSLGMPYEVVGCVTGQASAETGLAKGTPVVLGGGDQQMQAIGNGIVSPGCLSSTIGTGGQILAVTNQPQYKTPLRTHTFCGAAPNTWVLLGATLSAGLSLRWFSENILHGMDYREIDNHVEKLPPCCEGLLFLPYLVGERTPHFDSNARGVFFGLKLEHTRIHMARAVMEGVVFSLKDSIELFSSMGVSYSKVIASGGGSKSRLWLQMQADIFETDIYTTKTTEHACMGAAISAGVGCGLCPDYQSACERIIQMCETPILPNKENSKIYQYYYDLYRELYEHSQSLFPRLPYQA